MSWFDLTSALRRIRRRADLSQRELGAACGVATSVIAHAEAGRRDMPVALLARAAELAGLRLCLLDADGTAVPPMAPDAVKDSGCRRFPAHLDTRHGDEDWWGGPHRPRLSPPRYTFDRDRTRRDGRRQAGTPDDHHRPQAGDSLAERRVAREEEARRRQAGRREAAWRARLAAGEVPGPDWGSGCTCQTGCEYEEGRNEDLAHSAECACRCDVH